MTQQSVLKEIGFYQQGSITGWGVLRALLLRSLFSQRPSTSLALQKATSQNHVQKVPISLSVHQAVTKTAIHPLWNVHLWVSELPSSHSCSPPSGSGVHVLSLHVAVQETCAVIHCPRSKRVTSLYVFKESISQQLSIPDQSSAPSISPESGWLGRSRSSPSSVVTFFRQTSSSNLNSWLRTSCLI